jgi:hypothetical protein
MWHSLSKGQQFAIIGFVAGVLTVIMLVFVSG